MAIHRLAYESSARNTRAQALASFRSGKTPILVATDVAARGLHIKVHRCCLADFQTRRASEKTVLECNYAISKRGRFATHE